MIVDINNEHLELAKKSVGERTSIFAVDVGKIEEWGTLKKKVDEEFGLSLFFSVPCRSPDYTSSIAYI